MKKYTKQDDINFKRAAADEAIRKSEEPGVSRKQKSSYIQQAMMYDAEADRLENQGRGCLWGILYRLFDR